MVQNIPISEVPPSAQSTQPTNKVNLRIMCHDSNQESAQTTTKTEHTGWESSKLWSPVPKDHILGKSHNHSMRPPKLLLWISQSKQLSTEISSSTVQRYLNVPPSQVWIFLIKDSVDLIIMPIKRCICEEDSYLTHCHVLQEILHYWREIFCWSLF